MMLNFLFSFSYLSFSQKEPVPSGQRYRFFPYFSFSSLQYKVITEGSGKKPSATSQVKCHYEGTFLNGAKFDSSYDRNEPAVFGLNQVIAGWTEGVQLMSEGSKYEFYIPYNLAYGEHGAPGAIPPYAALKFVVELIEVL